MGMFALFSPMLCAIFVIPPKQLFLALLQKKRLPVLLLTAVVLFTSLLLSELLPSRTSSPLAAILIPFLCDYTLVLALILVSFILFPKYEQISGIAFVLVLASLYVVIRGGGDAIPIYHYFIRPMLWASYYFFAPLLHRYCTLRLYPILRGLSIYVCGAAVYTMLAYLTERSYYFFSFLLLACIWIFIGGVWGMKIFLARRHVHSFHTHE